MPRLSKSAVVWFHQQHVNNLLGKRFTAFVHLLKKDQFYIYPTLKPNNPCEQPSSLESHLFLFVSAKGAPLKGPQILHC